MTNVNMHGDKFNPVVMEEVDEAINKLKQDKNLEAYKAKRLIYENVTKEVLDAIENLGQKTTRGLNARNFALVKVIVDKLIKKENERIIRT